MLVSHVQPASADNATDATVAAAGDDRLETMDCVINPSVIADLGSSVPGVLSHVKVDRSDFVNKGEVVAQLDSGVELASVELARARAGLTAELDLRATHAAFGRRQLRRTDDLFKRKVISTNDKDERETESRVAQIQLRQARENLQLAKLEATRAEEILKRRSVVSPISGVVMERFRTVGEYVEDKPIVRIAQLDPLHVEVIVPVAQLGKVRNGMQAEVWSESVGGEVWDASVSRVDRVADIASGTYGVRLTLANPDFGIPAGLRCRVRFRPMLAADIEPAPPVAESPAVVEPAQRDAPPTALVVQRQPTESAPVAEAQICRQLGPYPDLATAESAAAPLIEQGAEVRVMQQATDEPVMHGVVSAPLETRADRSAYLARLREAGIEDYALMTPRDGVRRVSLGLYRRVESAQRRLDRLTALGFDVELRSRHRRVERHYLQVHGNEALAALTDRQLPAADCERLASR